MSFRNTIGFIALCSSLVAVVRAEPESCLEAVSAVRNETVVGAVGLSGDPVPARWLFLTQDDEMKFREIVVSEGEIVDERLIEPLPGQDVPNLPIDFAQIGIDSGEAFRIAAESARAKRIDFDSAHFHLRCRDSGSEPVWLLKLLGEAQDSRGIVYLSAVTGEVLRTAWTIREIEDFAAASPAFTRTVR